MPTVSICIPTYNQVDSFKRAFESVLSQEYLDYEVIVTDDSNDDGILNYLRSINTPKAVRYYKNFERLGAPANWNKAISLAAGKYIKILHHDDWFSSPLALQKFITPFEMNSNINFVYCSIQNVYEDGTYKVHKPPRKYKSINKNLITYLLMGNWIGPPSSVMYRNSRIWRFDESLKWLVDVDFYIRLGSRGEIFYIDDVLICGTCGGKEQLSRSCENNPSILVYEHFYLLNKLRPYFLDKSYKGYLATIQRIIAKFTIDSAEKVSSYGYKADIPVEIISFMKYVKKYPTLSRIYAKMLEFYRKLL